MLSYKGTILWVQGRDRNTHGKYETLDMHVNISETLRLKSQGGTFSFSTQIRVEM